MGRIEDSLKVAKRVDQQVRAAKQAEEELNLSEYRLVEELGDNAVSQAGFSRDDVVPRFRDTLNKTLVLGGFSGFVKPEDSEIASGRKNNRFRVATDPILISGGAVALQLVLSDFGPSSGAPTFWDVLEAEGVQTAAVAFCGVDAPSILVTDPASHNTVSSIALAPREFRPVGEDISRRFADDAFPLRGITPLSSPYHREQISANGHCYDDASHLTDNQLVWAAGLHTRFDMYLDVIEERVFR